MNTGSVTVWLEFGDVTVTASVTTSMPLVAGATEVFSAPNEYMAAITASSSVVLYVTPGEGL